MESVIILPVNVATLTQSEARAARLALIRHQTSLWEIQQAAPEVQMETIKMQVGWNYLHPCAQADAERRGLRLRRRDGGR